MTRIKRLIFMILAFTLCFNITAFADAPCTIGDANLDGFADNLDAATVLKHDACLLNLEGEGLLCADYNEDGVVNSLDAAMILRFDAGFQVQPGTKTVINIVDDSYGKEAEDALEYFYMDDTYAYFYGSMICRYITVYYSDGTSENLMDAFNNGIVTVADLDCFGIVYNKEHKYYTLGAHHFHWIPPENDAYYDVINGMEYYTDGFVNTQAAEIDSVESAIERAKAEVGDRSLATALYDEVNEVWCIRLWEPEYDTIWDEAVYMDKNGITLLITKGSSSYDDANGV